MKNGHGGNPKVDVVGSFRCRSCGSHNRVYGEYAKRFRRCYECAAKYVALEIRAGRMKYIHLSPV